MGTCLVHSQLCNRLLGVTGAGCVGAGLVGEDGRLEIKC